MNHPDVISLGRAGIASALLLLCVACAGAEPASRPTYTPYPTYTAFPTATARPTYTPYPPPTDAAESAGEPTVIDSGLVKAEYLVGRVYTLTQEAMDLFDNEDYAAALASFQEALELNGKPSAALEGWTGHSYSFLREYPAAIRHYSNAINIKADALTYYNRARAYLEVSQCDMAIPDAKAALSLEPLSLPQLATDVEANGVLAQCYAHEGNTSAALQHIDAAIERAEEYYQEEDLEALRQIREGILLTS